MSKKMNPYYAAERKFIDGWKERHRGEAFQGIVLNKDDPRYAPWRNWLRMELGRLPMIFRLHEKNPMVYPVVCVVCEHPSTFIPVYNLTKGAEA